MKIISPPNHFLICLFIVVVPVAQGCSTLLKKPNFSYDSNHAYEILDPPAAPPPKWFQQTTDIGHHVGRATLISALVAVYAIVRWTDLFEDDDDEFGFNS